MFERNRVDSVDQGTVSVEITLHGGDVQLGKLTMPAGRSVIDHLNGAASFVEFEPFDGEKTLLAKSQLRAVRALQVPRVGTLGQKLRDLDGFDPFQILGLDRAAGWDTVRSAYHKLAKAYHPDRYAMAELPEEVNTYLSGMARRINAAYSVLEATYAQKRQYAGLKQEPVYTSPGRPL